MPKKFVLIDLFQLKIWLLCVLACVTKSNFITFIKNLNMLKLLLLIICNLSSHINLPKCSPKPILQSNLDFKLNYLCHNFTSYFVFSLHLMPTSNIVKSRFHSISDSDLLLRIFIFKFLLHKSNSNWRYKSRSVMKKTK